MHMLVQQQLVTSSPRQHVHTTLQAREHCVLTTRLAEPTMSCQVRDEKKSEEELAHTFRALFSREIIAFIGSLHYSPVAFDELVVKITLLIAHSGIHKCQGWLRSC